MERLGHLADEQTPLLTDLQRAAPDLDTFFTRVGPFADASRPAIDSLGEAAAVGTRAFTEGARRSPSCASSRSAQPFARPLRQFLETIDDRKRAIEEDPRAKATAPPAPIPPPSRAAAASRAWRRSGTTSTGRRSASTCSTTRATCCARRSRLRRTASTSATRRLRRRRTARPSSAATRTGPNQPGIFSPDPLDDGGTPARPRCGPRAGSRRTPRRAARRRPARGRTAARPARPVASPGHAAARPPRAARLAHARAAAAPSRSGRARGLTPEELQNRLDQVLPQVAPQAPSEPPVNLDFLLAP